MSLTKTKILIITCGLLIYHGEVSWILPTQVYSTYPARLNCEWRQQCLMFLGLQPDSGFTHKLAWHTPQVWHPIFFRISGRVPLGSTCRRRGKRKAMQISKIWDVSCVDLRTTSQWSETLLLATASKVMLCCDSSLWQWASVTLAVACSQPTTAQTLQANCLTPT